jgi:hypothetical protein
MVSWDVFNSRVALLVYYAASLHEMACDNVAVLASQSTSFRHEMRCAYWVPRGGGAALLGHMQQTMYFLEGCKACKA